MFALVHLPVRPVHRSNLVFRVEISAGVLISVATRSEPYATMLRRGPFAFHTDDDSAQLHEISVPKSHLHWFLDARLCIEDG